MAVPASRRKARDDMAISPLAGLPAPKAMLIDPAALEREYFQRQPDLGHPNQLVSFGTSGHRGSSLRGTFTEAHILAITQAICDYRRSQGTDGPLYMGKDTHALSAPAQRTALEVLAANNVETIIQRGRRRDADAGHLACHSGLQSRPQGAASPTASSSRRRTTPRGWRLQVQPDQRRAGGHRVTQMDRRTAPTNCCGPATCGVKRVPFATAIKADSTHEEDFVLPYVNDLRQRHRHGGHPRRRPEAGRGSARRRRGALLGADQFHLQAGHRRW